MQPLVKNWLEIVCSDEKFIEFVRTATCPADAFELFWERNRNNFLNNCTGFDHRLIIKKTTRTHFVGELHYFFNNTSLPLLLNIPRDAGICARQIDPRSPSVEVFIDDIFSGREISDDDRTLWSTIGSDAWEKGLTAKHIKSLQKKCNSEINETDFEESCRLVGVKCLTRDEFGKFLYNGSPGDISDFIIYLDSIAVNIEIKMLGDEDNLNKNNVHDGYIGIVINWHTYTVSAFVLDDNFSWVLDSEKFKAVLSAYNVKLATEFANGKKHFIGINALDANMPAECYRF